MRWFDGLRGAAFLVWMTWTSLSFSAGPQDAEDHSERFAVGFAKRDITPQKPMPMWGYGARHAMLSEGTLTPLWAKAVVIQAGEGKLAIVGLDLGRGPTRAMTERIRREISEKAGIEHVLMSGSHTHHGPCIELLNREGSGKGTFDDAVAYNEKLPGLLIEAILEADSRASPRGWRWLRRTCRSIGTATRSGSRARSIRCWPRSASTTRRASRSPSS